MAVEAERVVAVPHEEREGLIEARIWRMWDRPHMARARRGARGRLGRPRLLRHASVEEDQGDPRPPWSSRQWPRAIGVKMAACKVLTRSMRKDVQA